MAFPSIGFFVVTEAGTRKQTIALNLASTGNKVALFTNSVVSPDLTTDTKYGVAPWNANEASGTGYSAGGIAVVSPTYAHTAGGVMSWDMNDPAWTTVSITVRGALYYAAAITSEAIFAQPFGGDFVVVAGNLTIIEPTAGVATIDIIP